MFFQHFLFQMKSKEYNTELEVLVTRYPCPALAAEWYLRWPSLPAPVTAPLPHCCHQSARSSWSHRAWFQWWSWPMARLMFFRSQKERILKQFLKRGSFSCPKIELGSWELVAGWRGQSFRLLPSPSPEVTQASAPAGTQGGNACPVQVTSGHSETSPSCVTVKCIQPTGSIYTITVSKVSVGFLLVSWKDVSLPLRILWRLHPRLFLFC